LTFKVVLTQFRCYSNNSRNAVSRADWIVDLGPEGGDKVGESVVAGTPEEVAEHSTSHTGRYLKEVLKQHPPEVLAG